METGLLISFTGTIHATHMACRYTWAGVGARSGAAKDKVRRRGLRGKADGIEVSVSRTFDIYFPKACGSILCMLSLHLLGILPASSRYAPLLAASPVCALVDVSAIPINDIC